jgi:hypothetical protein
VSSVYAHLIKAEVLDSVDRALGLRALFTSESVSVCEGLVQILIRPNQASSSRVLATPTGFETTESTLRQGRPLELIVNYDGELTRRYGDVKGMRGILETILVNQLVEVTGVKLARPINILPSGSVVCEMNGWVDRLIVAA